MNDVHTTLILFILQFLNLFCLAGVTIVVINLKRVVDRNASAGWEIEDRLRSISSTLYEIKKLGDTKD